MTDLNASAAVSPMDCSVRGDTPLGTNAWLALYVPFFALMKSRKDAQVIWLATPARSGEGGHSVTGVLMGLLDAQAGHPSFDHILNLVLTLVLFNLTFLVIASPILGPEYHLTAFNLDILPKIISPQLTAVVPDALACCTFAYSPSYS